jgi:hypothetical protein
MVMPIVLGMLAMWVYASFAEWFVHRYGMHTDRLSRWAFQRHAIQHHSNHRALKNFYAPSIVYQIWESSAIPLLWFAHIPLYLLAGKLWAPAAGVGMAIGAAVYTVAYEVIHFHIHAPRGYWFQRTRVFHFYCEYHRVHHHRARWNYNVVLPLADIVLGTFSLADLPPETSAPPGLPRHTGPGSVFGRQATAEPGAAGSEGMDV